MFRPRFNEYDTGYIEGPDYNDRGRITVIGLGSDPHDPHAEYNKWKVVYHRYFGPLANTDEPLGEFSTLEKAREFGWKTSEEWNKKFYDERDERERNRKPLKIDWDEIRRRQREPSKPGVIGYVLGESRTDDGKR